MADIEAAAPTFTHLLRTEAVPADNRIDVYFGAEDRSGYKLGIAAGIVPVVLTELSARLQQLSATPDGEIAASARGTYVQLVANKKGAAVAIGLDGYELVVSLAPDKLATLHREIGQLLHHN